MTNRLSDSGAIAFDVLTKENYRSWRVKAEALLRVSDLWDHVDKDEESSAVGELWMKKDEIAKSKLILHISSELLLLLENCTTAREVWSKLENVYDNKDKDGEDSTDDCEDNDEDDIINAIEDSVEDFFNMIKILRFSKEETLMDFKKLLSSFFTNDLSSRLKTNNAGNLRYEEKIVNTVGDFIDVIDKLSNIEIQEQQKELVFKFIDTLLVIFDIEPHKNDNDEAESDADAAKIPYDNMNGDKKMKKDGMTGKEISSQASDNTNTELFGDDETDDETEAEAETETRNLLGKLADIWRKMLQSKQQVDHEEFPCELENRDSIRSVMDFPNPPPTLSLKKTRKCGVCREEGHNRTTCPMNKSDASKSIIQPSKVTKSPKRSYKCGVCGNEGHNRTTCPMNKSSVSVFKTTADKATETSHEGGVRGHQGHEGWTYSQLGSVTSSPKPAASSTPARTHGSGLFGGEEHNRSTRSRDSVTSRASTRATPRCSTCGGEGHNSRTCGRRSTSSSSYNYMFTPSPSMSFSGGGRSYTCGNCGGSGHNRRTCTQ
ncbi:uncharacterized protein LOC124178776 isoform X2 [Neodiprion fabricii]|uniref:uncharacterized protein LOC124178776 isoform X2 n=1 Tax=Neodiprion fabricii TaxID=2872261 RepID=UPI001ED97C88|nr:uncharacterized protein LOC124178776 isoform X2 [Neodiprion fabricii]